MFLEIVYFFIFGGATKLQWAGGGAQRPVWRSNEPKRTGAHSARARTRGKNLLVVSEKMFFKVWTTIILLSYFGCLVKQIFSAGFRSVPSFGTGSSAEKWVITAGLQNVLIFFKITFEPIFSAITDTVPLISNYVASCVIILHLKFVKRLTNGISMGGSD